MFSFRLYPFPDWLGTSEGFTGRDNYLANNPIGDNIALSIRLFAGWRARLYTEPNYTGQSQLIDADDPDLSDNIVGTSTTSIDASTLGVAVYDQPSFGSTEHFFSGCDNDLSDNPIGENRISSVRIPPGWRLKLWDGKNKTGKKVVIQGIENADLADTIDNLASSLCADTPQDQESAGETEDWTTE